MARSVLAMLACLVMLPSCITKELWKDRAGVRTLHTPRLIGSSTDTASGELSFGGDGRVGEAWLRDQDGRAAWSVVAPRDGDPVSVAMAGRLGAVERVVLDAQRPFVDADLTRSEVEVAVFSRFEPERIGREIELGELGDAAADVLAITRRNAFVFASDPWLQFPPVYRECLQRLDTLALGSLVDGKPDADVDVLAFVLLDDEGLPCFEPGSTRRPAPALAYQEVDLEERLDLLAQVELVVRVRIDGREHLLRLNPEQLWLWSDAERMGEQLVHRGRWKLFPADPDAPAGEGRHRIAYEATIRTRRFELFVEDRPVGAGMPTWEKIAWSFVTVPLDIVTLPLQGLLHDLEDDEEEDWRPRRRR